MIITEPSARSPPKNAQPLNSNAQSGSQQPLPPPIYQNHRADYPYLLRNPSSRGPPPESAKKRFWKAFAVAVLICLLFGMFSNGINDLAHLGKVHDGWDGSWPIPANVHTEQCITGHAWSSEAHPYQFYPEGPYPHSVGTSFNVPLDSDELLFLSRGGLSSGIVNIVPVYDAEDDSLVKTDVTMYYSLGESLHRAKVCLIRRDEAAGVGIFTPRHWRHVSPKESMYFVVTIHLPTSRSSNLFVPALETEFSNYEHKLGPFDGAVEFGSLSVHTSNARVYAEPFFSKNAIITTSNAGISGTFNSSKNLALITSNGPIDVHVGLQANEPETTPKVAMVTTNGPLRSSISLFSADTTGGEFKVEATTSNNRIDVDFPFTPVDSVLHFDAITSNGPASVALHSAYEGKFTMMTSNARPVVQRSGAEDPSGNNRRREVSLRDFRGTIVTGEVGWVPAGEGKEKSAVVLKSTNARVSLTV